MKKLALSLLFSTALIINTLTPIGSTTNLGPVQIVTTNGSNEFAAGTVNLYGTINIGQSNTDIITFQGSGINLPSTGLLEFLVVNDSGQLQTISGSNLPSTFGTIVAAGSTNQSVTFGISGGNDNYLHFTSDAGDFTIQANTTGSNLNLSANNNIILNSLGLIPTSGYINLLGIDSSGNILTPADTSAIVNSDLTISGNLYPANINTGNLFAARNPGQSITLGNDTGTFTIASNNIAYPNSGSFNLLAIDSSGNVYTTNNTTAITCGNFTASSISTTGNLSANSTTLGSLTAATSDGQNITLGNSGGFINIISSAINYPSSGNTNFLAIDSSGNLLTATNSSNLDIGNLTAASNSGQTVSLGISSANYFDFTSDSGNITLGANVNLANLNLSANNHITLSSNDITYPGTGNNSLLTIDSSGNLATAGSGTNLTCGGLTAAGNNGDQVSLGINNSSDNYINFTTNTGNMVINAGASAAHLQLTANGVMALGASGALSLSFANVNPTANTNGYILLALDRTGNLVTSNSNNIYKFGSDATGNNFISLDNATNSNGITIASNALYLANQGLAPASGSTNVLTIDSNGKIGIVVSSKIHKEKIQKLKLDESFNSLTPVSYNYKGSNHLEYGFIAEDLANIPALKNAVIYDKEGNAMSVNYQNVFVAVTEDHFQTKADLQKQIDDLTSKYEKMASIIAYFEKELQNK